LPTWAKTNNCLRFQHFGALAQIRSGGLRNSLAMTLIQGLQQQDFISGKTPAASLSFAALIERSSAFTLNFQSRNWRNSMATKAKTQSPNPDAHELAVVVTADLAQITADARTHPDEEAKARILRCVARLENVVSGQMTAELKGRLERAAKALQQNE